MAGNDLEVVIEAESFSRVLKAVRGFDKTLSTAMRKRIRDAAKPVVKEIKAKVLAGGPSRTGVRRGIAAGTKVSIRTGRMAGVSITTSAAKMPAGKAPLVRAFEKRSFRHPVYANRENWVTQSGRPYFRSVTEQHRAQMQQAVLAALKDAINTVERAS